MATAQGLRYAVGARIPTPGSGLDDQDRFIIGGVVQPANSITPPVIGSDFESKQRGRLAGVMLPDSVLDDEQDRYHLAGVIQPTLSNVNISAQQRAFVAGLPGWGGGTGFTENDRAHIAGIYPYNEQSFFSELFDVSYTLATTMQENLLTGSADGVVDGVLNSIASSLSGIAFDRTTVSDVVISLRAGSIELSLTQEAKDRDFASEYTTGLSGRTRETMIAGVQAASAVVTLKTKDTLIT